jgi:peptide/nickel transport system ATP-binding protein
VLVSLRGVAASHGQRQVVFDASLDVYHHRCVALVGESGSGKTTLARSIAGLHRHWTGDIELHGERLAPSARHRSAENRREIQYVFQNPYSSLNPRKTVGQIVGQPLRMFFATDRHGTHEQTVRALAQVQLSPSVIHRLPHELSGGERQRVAIARALAAKPALLICDEVTSALDVSVQAATLELLGELQRDLGLALLFITHDLGVVASVADRILVMESGVVCERGLVEAVLARPQEPYTRRLIAAAPSLTADVEAQRSDLPAGAEFRG